MHATTVLEDKVPEDKVLYELKERNQVTFRLIKVFTNNDDDDDEYSPHAYDSKSKKNVMNDKSHTQLFYNTTDKSSNCTPSYRRTVYRPNNNIDNLYWYGEALKPVKSTTALWTIDQAKIKKSKIFGRIKRPRVFSINNAELGSHSVFEYGSSEHEPKGYSGEVTTPFDQSSIQRYRWVRYKDGSRWVFIARNDPNTPLVEFRKTAFENEYDIVFLEPSSLGWTYRNFSSDKTNSVDLNQSAQFTGRYPSVFSNPSTYRSSTTSEFLKEHDLNDLKEIFQINNLKPPTYNYLSFLQELIYITLYDSLINLLKKELSYKVLSHSNEKDCSIFHPSKKFMLGKVLPIINELIKLLMKNGTRIFHFNLSAPSHHQYFQPMLFSSLQSFICDNNGHDFNHIIMELSNYSKNILNLEIKKPQNDQNISHWINLINSQKNLQKLKLELFYNHDSYKIALSIPSQYHTLKEVELVDCKFTQTILLDELSKCSNLISLKIKDCDKSPTSSYSPSYFLDYIEHSSYIINNFKSLKSLYISKSQLSQKYFLSFIGQDSKLEKITLSLIDFFKYPDIIPFISFNCFQLKILEIVLVEETFEKIIPIIENCKLLEEISIWEKYDWIGHEFYDYHDNNFLNPNQVIKTISSILPKNLKKFHFPQIFNFSYEGIKFFIQNSPITLSDLRFYIIIDDKNDVINLLENFAYNTGNRKSIIKHSKSRIDSDFYKPIHHIFVAKFF
ncbi:1443_t:CDS:2 [Rhizophagus irregularis]|nr:1443_t:CDS:2 [Rhizophagus irregularis]